jgi:hypothetical protein
VPAPLSAFSGGIDDNSDFAHWTFAHLHRLQPVIDIARAAVDGPADVGNDEALVRPSIARLNARRSRDLASSSSVQGSLKNFSVLTLM